MQPARPLTRLNLENAPADGQVRVARDDIDVIRLDRLVVPDFADRQGRGARENLCQLAFMIRIQVLHEHEAHPRVQPQRFEQLCEGLQATGGGADSDDRKCTSPLLAGLFRDLVVLQLRFGGLLGALSRMARSSVGQAITSSRSFAHGLVPAIRAPRRASAACACRPGRQATMGDPLLDELLGPPRWAATNPRFYTLVRLRAARLKGLESPTVDEARPAIPGKPRNTLSPESGTTRADDAVRWTLLYASMSPTRSLRRLAPERDEQGVWPSTSSPVNSSTRASFWTSRPPRRGPRGRAAPGGPLAQQGHRGPAGAPLASIDNPGSGSGPLESGEALPDGSNRLMV